MYKVIIAEKASRKISADQMKIGDIGEVVESTTGHMGAILLRTYACYVDLRNPRETWQSLLGSSFRVRLFRPGETVTLEIRDGGEE